MEDMVETRDDDDHFLRGLIKSSRPILEQKIYNKKHAINETKYTCFSAN